MFKKVLCASLAVFVFNVLLVQTGYASPTQEKRVVSVEKVKQSVCKLGTGAEAKVEVRLLDGTKLKGYILESREDNFVVVDSKTGATTTIEYAQVKELKGRNGLTAAKVGINIAKGVGIVAAVAGGAMLLMLLVVPRT